MKMYKWNRFGIGMRATAVALGASLGMAAHAQYLYGTVNLVPSAFWSENGTDAGPTTFFDNVTGPGGTYDNFAGGLNFNRTGGVGLTNGLIVSICSSFNETYQINASGFNTTAYGLLGAIDGGPDGPVGSILLGNGFSQIGLPGNDSPPETGSSFLRAAELYGKYDTAAETGGNANRDVAALQLAIWQTLYPGDIYLAQTSGHGGSHGASSVGASRSRGFLRRRFGEPIRSR